MNLPLWPSAKTSAVSVVNERLEIFTVEEKLEVTAEGRGGRLEIFRVQHGRDQASIIDCRISRETLSMIERL